jgi:transposase InsO family protein
VHAATSGEEAHVNRLTQIIQAQQRSLPEMRGQAQGVRRELERQVRLDVLDFRQFTATHGLTRIETAAWLGISERTLRQWEYDWRVDGLPAERRGRPLARSSREARQAVLDWIEDVGPGIGVPSLQGHFTAMPRAELQDLLRRYRELWRKQHERWQYVLHWQQPGSVWAMDFSEAPLPIDGVYPYLLAVRDLASGMQLLWEPVATMTADVTMAALTMLFTVHGAPVVLKSDNGSAFRAAATKSLLQGWGVVPLFSPPGCPAYNGACEASIGSLKKRTAYQAEHAGRPGRWTSNDVATARQQANEVARPWGAHGPRPAQVWESRQPISRSEGESFQSSVKHMEQEQRAAGGIPMDANLEHYQQAAIDREVIRRALVAHGLLLFTRRRVPTPIKRRKVTKIM